jgi:hypothetical protein
VRPRGPRALYEEWCAIHPGRAGVDLDRLVDQLIRYRKTELTFAERKARRYRALAVSLLEQRRALVAQRNRLAEELAAARFGEEASA